MNIFQNFLNIMKFSHTQNMEGKSEQIFEVQILNHHRTGLTNEYKIEEFVIGLKLHDGLLQPLKKQTMDLSMTPSSLEETNKGSFY